MKIVIQSFILITASVIIFVIVNTALVDYTVYFLGFIIFVGMLLMLIRKLRKKGDLFMGSNFDMFIITSIILLTIFLTSAIASPIFFLLYFLLFGISFMFEPPVIFVMLACILLLFGQEAITGDIYSNMLKMGSLILLAPLAFFFGNEYKRREKVEEQIAAEAGAIKESADKLLSASEKATIDEKRLLTEVKKIRKKAEDIKEEVGK